SRFAILDVPHKRRRRHKILRQIRKAHLGDVRRVDYDLPVDAPNLPAIIRQQSCLNRLERLGVVLIMTQYERNLLSPKLIEQLCRIQQVVLVMLLEDSQRRGRRQRAEVDRLGPNLRCNISESQSDSARWQSQPPRFANQAEIRTVD